MDGLLISAKIKAAERLSPYQHKNPIMYNDEYISGSYNLEELVESLAHVAFKRFTDYVAVPLIEGKLLSELATILSPVSLFTMQANMVILIAGESRQSRILREELTRKIGVPKTGSVTCNLLMNFRHGLSTAVNGDSAHSD
ncbi:hypothetical protein DL768_009619 [Monosporascus sp. mg162]|nr:hypothetical protein DL768_009619 [Monosporascus sp. mg162]